MTRSAEGRDVTRREALELMGRATGVGLLASTGVLSLSGCAADGPGRPVIRTLQGDVTADALGEGPLLFHEHLSMQLGEEPTFMADVDLMIEEVRAAEADGVALIVDGGHPDMGRDIAALRRITNETGMPIVASGGYYMQRTYPEAIASMQADQIADGIVADAIRERHGAFGEIGQQDGELTADERKVHEAVALAHVRTGIPVFTHNAYSIRREDVPPGAGLRQLDIYEEAGADLGSVAIGHMCCLDDPEAEVFSEIARRGAYVGFDRVTLNFTMPDENRVRMAMALIERGHADRLLLSSDFFAAGSLKARGGPGLAQTATVFGPMLLEAGLDEETLRMILVDNPRRFLEFAPRV